MNRIIFICTLLILINGCASKLNLELSLDTWIGHNVDGLVQHWGAPSNVNSLENGSTSYSWLFDDGIANSPIEGSINATAIYCKVIVDVSKNETIEAWQLEGNDCKA